MFPGRTVHDIKAILINTYIKKLVFFILGPTYLLALGPKDSSWKTLHFFHNIKEMYYYRGL